jgi:hypothetical protein
LYADDEFGFLEKKDDEHQIDAEKYDTPPPHPSPSLTVNNVPSSDGSKESADTGRKQVKRIHSRVLMDEEYVRNCYLHNRFANSASETRKKVAHPHIDLGICTRKPDTGR